MLLVDALYINNSGGLELLNLLIESLKISNVSAFYLLDERINNGTYCAEHCVCLKASLRNRLLFYLKNSEKFEKILCFGNVPPPIRTKAVVYTYFHNINLLKIPALPIFQYTLSYLKQRFVLLNRVKTDYWIVQTSNTQNELEKILNVSRQKVLVYPFWRDSLREECNGERRDYVYIANYTLQKQHLLLIKAWRKLYKQGYNLTLHLTLADYPKEIEEELSFASREGVSIINHGTITREQVMSLYKDSKATIYSSLNESFGLGIIEALSFNCDVIGPDLPYIHSICQASSTFPNFSVNDIVNSVIQYEEGLCIPSFIKISNELEQLINLLK